MKRKIKLTDKTTGKIIEGETTLRNTLHFEIQKNNRAHVFKNRKAYTRKTKYKNEEM